MRSQNRALSALCLPDHDAPQKAHCCALEAVLGVRRAGVAKGIARAAHHPGSARFAKRQ